MSYICAANAETCRCSERLGVAADRARVTVGCPERCAMRHFVWAAVMLLAGLGITMGTANVLQSAAIARATVSSEPFVIETAKSQTRPAAVANKERVPTGRSRDAYVRTASLAGM